MSLTALTHLTLQSPFSKHYISITTSVCCRKKWLYCDNREWSVSEQRLIPHERILVSWFYFFWEFTMVTRIIHRPRIFNYKHMKWHIIFYCHMMAMLPNPVSFNYQPTQHSNPFVRTSVMYKIYFFTDKVLDDAIVVPYLRYNHMSFQGL